MNMDCHFLYLDLLQFISGLFYSFEFNNLMFILLNLFLSILFILTLMNIIVFLFHFSDFCMQLYRAIVGFYVFILSVTSEQNCFLISFSEFCMQLYRKTVFCILILSLWLNSSISCNGLIMATLGLSTQIIMFPVNKVLLLSFQSGSLFPHLVLFKTFSTMLSRSSST